MDDIQGWMMDYSSESDSENEMLLLEAAVMVSIQRAPTSVYMLKRKTHGEWALTKEFTDAKFRNYFRMSRTQFSEILQLIGPEIEREGCNASRPIGSDEKLGVFLRYLATGDSYVTIATSYRMGDRTVSSIVKEVSEAIWRKMQPLHMPQPTRELWESTAEHFKTMWQFPHCIGAIDGKHVLVKKPGKSGFSYYNYKNTFSIVLMAIVDPCNKFLTVDVGSQGRFSDGNIFNTSIVARKLIDGSLDIPSPELIPSIQEPMPYVFVGDEAFPLSENLMRPYPKQSLASMENKIFNYRLSRARQTVECSFGILATKFRVFRAPFESKVSTVIKVTKAACVIHNYLRKGNGSLNEEEEDMLPLPNDQLHPLVPNPARSSRRAFEVREKFRDFFNNPSGMVPWQRASVQRGKV